MSPKQITDKMVENLIKQSFKPIEYKISKLQESSINNLESTINLKEILNYINQGIEISTWFKDFLFINLNNNNFTIAKIHYGCEPITGCTFFNVENEGYQLIYLKSSKNLGDIVTIIEEEYNTQIEMYVYTKEELDERSSEALLRYKRESLELSTVIIPSGHNDFWIQLFLEAKRKEQKYYDYDYGYDYKFDIRELALHKQLDECVDHMLTWFGV